MSATKPFQLHLTEEQLARYKDTAHARKTNLSALIRRLMDAESEAVGIGGGEQPKGAAPAPKKSMFGEHKRSEHHAEIMATLKGRPLAEYCRVAREINPETGRMEGPPEPVLVDESESKSDRRERELIEQAEEKDRLASINFWPAPPLPEEEDDGD